MKFLDNNDLLPRIAPICLVQEMNLSEGKPTGFTGKKVLCRENARAAVITLSNIDVTLLEEYSGRDLAWALVTCGKVKTCVASFYSDIHEAEVDLKVTQIAVKCRNLAVFGDTNAHSTMWGHDENNGRGDRWEQYIATCDLFVANDQYSEKPTFCNHLGQSYIDVAMSNDPNLLDNWYNTETFHGSDHSIILSTSSLGRIVNEKLIQNIARTDWGKFQTNLADLPKRQILSERDLSERADLLVTNIRTVYDIACPPIKAYPGRPCKWWSKDLTNILRNKKLQARIARKYKGTQRGLRANIAKRSLGKLFQKQVRNAKTESWKKFTSNLEGYRNISSL